MNKIKVLIADDSLDFATLMKQNLEFNDAIEVVGIAKDGLEAIEMTKQLQPDVLVLDIIMPNLDGIGVVEKLNAENIDVKTIMLSAILSSEKQEKLTSILISLGVDYLMAKPFDIKSLVNRIIQISNNDNGLATQTNTSKQEIFSFVNQSNNETVNKESFESKITSIMHSVGIPARVKGYSYIREAILLAIENTDNSNKMTKDVYPKIAEKFNSTPTRVERAIRHALEISWNQNKESISSLIFGKSVRVTDKKPTNSEFIASIADKLKLEARKCS